MDAQATPRSFQKESFNPGIYSRRYACDRCRGHKLRCNRDATAPGNGPCHRCIKAKAQCTITSSSRPGRSFELDIGGGVEYATSKGPLHPSKGNGDVDNCPSSRSDNLILQAQPGQRNTLSGSMHGHVDPNNPAPQPSTNGSINLQDHSDSLQLLSVPWMDLIDMNAEESASHFDFDSPMQNSYAPDSFAASQPFHSIGNEVSDIDTSELSSWEPVTARDHEASRNSSQFGPSRTQDSLANNSVPTVSQSSNPISHEASTIILTPEERKEICIQKLSDLSASLMKNLNRLLTCSLATSFIFTPSDENIAEYLFKTIDGSSGQDNAIGTVLHSIEQFLQIFRDFRQALVDVAPQSSIDPVVEKGDTDASLDFDSQPGQFPEASSEEESVRRFKLLNSYKDRIRPPEPASLQHLPPTVSSSSKSHHSLTHLSVPSTLTLLTCYTCILKSFENIFLSLQHWLSVPTSSPLHAQLTPAIAGVQINGFPLDSYSHRSLQIKILLQVCDHMLDQMERALWFGEGEGDRRRSALADPTFHALLKVLLRQEGLDCDEENETGMKKVRDLLKIVGEQLK